MIFRFPYCQENFFPRNPTDQKLNVYGWYLAKLARSDYAEDLFSGRIIPQSFEKMSIL
jgi:hypothetical protein